MGEKNGQGGDDGFKKKKKWNKKITNSTHEIRQGK
jgi:hypothetical protein